MCGDMESTLCVLCRAPISQSAVACHSSECLFVWWPHFDAPQITHAPNPLCNARNHWTNVGTEPGVLAGHDSLGAMKVRALVICDGSQKVILSHYCSLRHEIIKILLTKNDGNSHTIAHTQTRDTLIDLLFLSLFENAQEKRGDTL